MFPAKLKIFLGVLWLLFDGPLAQQPSSDQQLIFPISVDLLSGDSSTRTLYVVTNLGPEVRLRFEFFSSVGGNFLSSSSLPIPTNGIFEETRPLDIVVIEHVGWTRLVIPASAKVQARQTLLSFTRSANSGFELVNSTQLEAVKPARKFRSTMANMAQFRAPVFGLVPNTERDPRQSAYAIVNPSSIQIAKVDFNGLDLRGKVICSSSFTIPPLNRVAKFVTEILSPCSPPILGSVEITSDVPIAVGGVEVFLPEGRFSSLPIIPVDFP